MTSTNQPGGFPANPVINPQTGQPLLMHRGPPTSGPSAPPRKIPGLVAMAVLHIVFGGASAVMGIVAIILRCYLSYVGNGVWSGVLFFCVTGILGIFGTTKKTHKGVIIAFVAMSIVSSVVAFQLMVYTAVGVSVERRSYCIPITNRYYSSTYGECYSSYGARVAVGALLSVIALAELVHSITCASVAGCTLWGCCGCCGADPVDQYAPVVVQYVPQQQYVPMTNMQPRQQYVVQEQSGSAPVPMQQQGQFMIAPQPMGAPQQNVISIPQQQPQQTSYTLTAGAPSQQAVISPMQGGSVHQQVVAPQATAGTAQQVQYQTDEAPAHQEAQTMESVAQNQQSEHDTQVLLA